MGGKSPFIILDDAPLSDDLIDNAAMSAFWNAGQNCSANMRQIVGSGLHDAFVQAVVHRADAIVIGDPLDPATEMGPLVSEEHRANVRRYLDIGRREGAVVSLDRADQGGEGWFMGPTVFAGLTPEMTIAREEIFGPVLGVLKVDGLDDAMRVANDTDYGLHATIYTRDIDVAMHMANRLECGTVAINGFTEGDMKTPFGGYKRSGSLARDKGMEALDQYRHSKTIWITNTQY
jgi:aldehyde dehydrogenase (NAD+)/gamma-glutamyl-gamma-aminobutyraldehyde dehydrogenase